MSEAYMYLKKGCNLKWPVDLVHNIVKQSTEDDCTVAPRLCNTWENVEHIVQCKAAKIKESLPEGTEFYYVQTDYKTEAEEEWAKFTYMSKKKATAGGMGGGAFLFRICVPIDKRFNSWVDDKCASDPCGPMEFQDFEECGNVSSIKNPK